MGPRKARARARTHARLCARPARTYSQLCAPLRSFFPYLRRAEWAGRPPSTAG